MPGRGLPSAAVIGQRIAQKLIAIASFFLIANQELKLAALLGGGAKIIDDKHY